MYELLGYSVVAAATFVGLYAFYPWSHRIDRDFNSACIAFLWPIGLPLLLIGVGAAELLRWRQDKEQRSQAKASVPASATGEQSLFECFDAATIAQRSVAMAAKAKEEARDKAVRWLVENKVKEKIWEVSSGGASSFYLEFPYALHTEIKKELELLGYEVERRMYSDMNEHCISWYRKTGAAGG